MMKAVDLRKGKTILHNGAPAVIHEAKHVAKGNKRSYMQAKIKNLKTGTMTEVRFNVDDRIEIPYVESKQYEFLYRDGENFMVMDLETYDQIPIRPDVVGDAAKWLKPNEKISCELFDGQMISFVLPFTVALEVTEAPPVVKGATATNQLKEVILETGAKVRVPPFIDKGERVNIDTRTGEYIDRAK
jgi:elongation factor P